MKTRDRRGFTLVEIMVATVAFAGMMVLLLTFFDCAAEAWKSSEKRVDVFREARAAMDLIRRDLRGLEINEELPAYLNPKSDEVRLTALLPPEKNGDVFFFLTTQSRVMQEEGKNRGDLCAVGYYLSYWSDEGAAGKGEYHLHRYFKSSDEAWRCGEGVSTYGVLPFLRTGLKLFWPARGDGDGDEVLARNVIDFKVKGYREDLTSFASGKFEEKPSFLDVSLVAYDRRTAKKLERKDWYENKKALQNMNRRVFSMRVAVGK